MSEMSKERRRHKRFKLTCPTVLADSRGRELLRTRTLDVSDGGLLLAVPRGNLMPVGEAVQVGLQVPRETPNTRMLEDVRAEAWVVRHQELPGSDDVGLTLIFAQPLSLELEV